jgi:rhodanese-related sulfurtransferase
MSSETQDTLGSQKKSNYALQNISKQDFIKELTTGIMPAPQYFSKNAMLNKNGYGNVNEIMAKANKALDITEFKKHLADAIVLDVRKSVDFLSAHIPGSIFIGIDGQFAPWVGTIIENINQKIVLIAPEGREEETILRLSRVGYDNCVGYLNGGISAWIDAGETVEKINSITAEEFSKLGINKSCIIDVRKPGEYENGHLESVENYPLDFINSWSKNFKSDQPTYIHCAGGYRSVIAASLLKKLGHHQLIDIAGGYNAIQKTNLSIVK